MPRARDELTAGEWAVLALLSEQPAHGFALARAIGKRALTKWLRQPVEHVRDARSLLMLKILFLTRREAVLEPLLTAQHGQVSGQADRLLEAVAQATGLERALLLWRLESTTAAIRFTETMLTDAGSLR